MIKLWLRLIRLHLLPLACDQASFNVGFCMPQDTFSYPFSGTGGYTEKREKQFILHIDTILKVIMNNDLVFSFAH